MMEKWEDHLDAEWSVLTHLTENMITQYLLTNALVQGLCLAMKKILFASGAEEEDQITRGIHD